jgi:hypothetical protein
MIHRFLLPTAVLLAVASHPATAQIPGAPTPSPPPTAGQDDTPEPTNYDTITYWKAQLPGGTYLVAHDSINAVSTQEYLLDGAARVTEVNVSTSGAFQPRFYFIEPISIAGPVGETAERVLTAAQAAAARVIPGDPIWAKVIKEYPTTTHAGTIEYRLETKAQLAALYQSLEASWIAGRSEVFTPAGASEFDTEKDEDSADEASEDAPSDPANP